ncbi:MAG: nitrogen regulation protein NR(II) [Duodenibacillus sp.]|nr:nitrogen regulation protein NR(II) [Duodenibacillus sp.]
MTQSRSFYAQVQAAADLLATSVIVLDRFARVRWCNSAAESLVGCSRRSLKGSDIGLLIPQVRDWVERFSEKDAKYAPYSAVTELCRPLVEPEPVHASISVLTGSDGLLILELTQVERVIEQARQEQEAGMSDASRVLLRNLAHEVKNPLGGIRGAAQLLEAELTSSEQREFTEVIIAEADRLQALVDRLLVPYRRERILTDVNLHEVLERARNLVMAEFSHGLTVTRDYDVSVPPIKGDAEQLIQVFLNLMRNAAEATRHLFAQERAEIVLRTRVARQCIIQRHRYKMALQVQVIDNGQGIDESIREKIFYPLVTGRDNGTGLGLSIVQTYVEQHGGSIEVDSQPGHTVFTLLFPLSKPQ